MGQQPETIIRNAWLTRLRADRWFATIFYNNRFQKGVPDCFLFHQEHGFRWVDFKVPDKYSFTKAQLSTWPKWEASGLGIWILTTVSESEYQKLFASPNWRSYLRPRDIKKSLALPKLWGELVRDFRRTTSQLLSAFSW